MSEKLTFTASDSGETTQMYILEQTRINNVNYILVTESEDDSEDANVSAYILKDISRDEDEEALYEPVEDDNELTAVSKVFAELLDDIEIEQED